MDGFKSLCEHEVPVGLTPVFLHGIESHEESWELTLQRLFSALGSLLSPFNIQEIWTLDCVQHQTVGSSIKVYQETSEFNDYSRDILNFLISFLPEEAKKGTVSINPPRFPPSVTDRRKAVGFSERSVIGIGRSGGAVVLYTSSSAFSIQSSSRKIHSAVEYSALFSSLNLVESATLPEFIKYKGAHRNTKPCVLDAVGAGMQGRMRLRSAALSIIDLGTLAPQVISSGMPLWRLRMADSERKPILTW
ncbi:hypothetical protein AcW1_003889 [Taiwanofungus camphoratus]|nr:hypothetical protein AcV5_003837 [Antrodia cinnamomea]KAI0937837.1 hypothetical protein AcW1_003889 [Antrodia cinnamomea]